MKTALTGIFLTIAALSAQLSFAGPVRNIELNLQTIQCYALKATDAPFYASYNRDMQTMEIVQNQKATIFGVTQLVPGVDGEINLVGENDQAGYLQMNIDPGKTSMALIGDVANYVSCSAE
jgi:hypothetical protein